MAADITFTTVNLPPAFLGQAYEAAVAYKGASSATIDTPAVTAQSLVQTGSLTGLPAGLALDTTNLGSLRITGTPTGAASAGAVHQSGVGAYTFQISITDEAGAALSSTYTLNLLLSQDDQVMQGGRTSQDGLM